MTSRLYQYVGTVDLSSQPAFDTPRTQIRNQTDALACLGIALTFIVDANGLLWIADRHSKHVACARGGDVLSAGQMTLETEDGSAVVTEATNQSTGYCPEPESWPAVAAALDKAGIQHPNKFTKAFLFRRCENCQQTNTVKEDNFTCAVCGAELSQEWNFSHDTEAE